MFHTINDAKRCAFWRLRLQLHEPGSAADAAAIAKARASYPLKTCLVADEAFTSIDKAVGHVHRVAGQPDRVIFVCCNDCVADFKAAPAKYLAKLDAAKKK
jgi:hypothetical protein